jgi:hypothetical protein
MVQAESDPIAERRDRLRALRAAAELASADQGDEEAEKQPLDATATEQQKEDPYTSFSVSLFFSVSSYRYVLSFERLVRRLVTHPHSNLIMFSTKAN